MSADAGPASPEAQAAPAEPAAPESPVPASPAPDTADPRPSGPTFQKTAGDTFDPQSNRAYEDGRSVLRVDGPTVLSGRDTNVSVHLPGSRGVAPSPGPVPEDHLYRLRARYAEVPSYDELSAALRDRHLLVLSGPSATGRSTTALQLLDAVVDGAVSRLEPVTDPRALPDRFESGRGYLGEIAVGRTDPTEAQADRLADLLVRNDAYCVLVALPDSALHRAFATYSRPCGTPDTSRLLRRHIRALVRAVDPSDLAGRLTDLGRSPRFLDALGPVPRPVDVAGLAALLVEHGRGGPDLDEVEARVTGFLDVQIEEWMAALRGPSYGDRPERMRRLTALRIALAVFDGRPRYVATEAAEELALLLARPARPSTPGAPAREHDLLRVVRLPEIDEDDVLLATTRLVRERAEVLYQGGTVPTEVLRFRDPRVPAALLRHVWLRHQGLRRPLVVWLDGLSRHADSSVRVRAAQAAGLLCTVDFPHTFSALIEPAAASRVRTGGGSLGVDEPDEPWAQRRGFAAVALDHAARDPLLRATVTGVLKRWRRADDVALRWTAAFALGYDVGLRSVASTLDELRILGTPQEATSLVVLDPQLSDDDREMLWTSARSLARLFGRGAHRAVLDQLERWIVARGRWSLRLLAQQTVVYLVMLRMASIGRPDPDAELDPLVEDSLVDREHNDDRSGWPVLLVLLDDQPDLTVRVARLLREALRSSAGELTATMLGGWMDLGQNDADALAALESFLPRLVEDRSGAARLHSLVSRKRTAWADPLRSDVADRLISVIATAVPEQGSR